MKANEFITEGLNHPIICVDVQPEYSGMNDGDENNHGDNDDEGQLGRR